MEEEARRAARSLYSKGKLGTAFPPRSSHPDSPFAPAVELMLKVSAIMSRPFVLAVRPVRVEGLAEHHVNGKPLLLYISHLI